MKGLKMLPDISMIDPLSIAPVQVGPGCLRRDLLAPDGVRVWMVHIASGAQWPHVDHHDAEGEIIFVLEGELLEGEHRIRAGTYVVFGPHSSHRPRSETGATLLGFNLLGERA
jgi:quercetin dioxygenase-like cupin family protein